MLYVADKVNRDLPKKNDKRWKKWKKEFFSRLMTSHYLKVAGYMQLPSIKSAPLVK